jgi:NADPH-dependent 2,4-dienoyl-CoA reductase/sulfur reductase-like enzyme
MAEHFDVVVAGAGPGGIAAAVTAGEGAPGRSVLLIDDNPNLGGQIWRHAGKPPAAAVAWFARLARLRNVTVWTGSRVVAVVRPMALLVETERCASDSGAGQEGTGEAPVTRAVLPGREVTHGNLILAMGARERFVASPGWTLPGVVGAGALQALVKSGLDVRGKRVILAGTGPLLLAVADLCVARGAVVTMIAEQATWGAVARFLPTLARHPSKVLQGAGYRWRLRGTRHAMDAYVTRVVRRGRELSVALRVGGREETHGCDVLGVGFHLIPNTELAQALACELTGEGFVVAGADMRTSVDGVLAIGELTGIGGVEKAAIEGQVAGRAATDHATELGRMGASVAEGRRFAAALGRAFALRPELARLATDETLVCRCEDVRLGEVRACGSARDAKLQTRCGMGPCQGRVCGPILQQVLGFEPAGVRAPIFPSSVGTLARASPDAASGVASAATEASSDEPRMR